MAGPSSRPYGSSFPSTSSPSSSILQTTSSCRLGDNCPYLSTGSPIPTFLPNQSPPHPRARGAVGRDGQRRKRQDKSFAATSATSTYYHRSTSSSSVLFEGPSTTSNSNSYPTTTYSSTYTAVNNNGDQSNQTDISSPGATDSSTQTFNAPWTYTATQTSTGTAAAQTSYVPGVLLDLILAGDSDSEAVYSVQMAFGDDMQNSTEDVLFPTRRIKRKSTTLDWDGGVPQTINLQVDLGSSDLVSSFQAKAIFCRRDYSG